MFDTKATITKCHQFLQLSYSSFEKFTIQQVLGKKKIKKHMKSLQNKQKKSLEIG